MGIITIQKTVKKVNEFNVMLTAFVLASSVRQHNHEVCFI